MSEIDELFNEQGAENLGDIFARVAHLETLQNSGSGAPLAATGISLSIRTKTANYTLTASDYNILGDATAGSITITLPTAASAYNATTTEGAMYNVIKINSNANTVTLAGNGAEIINGVSGSGNTQVITAQYDSITVQSDGTAWYMV